MGLVQKVPAKLTNMAVVQINVCIVALHQLGHAARVQTKFMKSNILLALSGTQQAPRSGILLLRVRDE
jgi:hypothetical protein